MTSTLIPGVTHITVFFENQNFMEYGLLCPDDLFVLDCSSGPVGCWH